VAVEPDPARADPELSVFEDPAALPRAWTVHHAECRTGRPLLERLTSADFDPRRTVLLEAGCPAPTASWARGVPVALERDAPERLRAVVELDEPGFLVLSDTWDPGWRARVDDRSAEILRANFAFRAVALPAGRHVVELRYAPASFRRGVALAGAALALGALGARLARRGGSDRVRT
jgi:hypothetical protein